uniref:BHLH domain-containing protein n=1 Tax=Triticum urartu TaxID=4572 RepID=A0A8R7QHN1_TRIUA
PPQTPHAGFVRGADARRAEGNGRVGQTAPSAAARERRRRISEKTAELSRLVPGGHRLNTAEMLQEAGRHVKLLQAQVGVLALMRTLEEFQQEKIVPPVARERMHALLTCGGVQERLAAEGKCLVPTNLVEAMAEDKAVRSNAPLIRDLTRFSESLPEQ